MNIETRSTQTRSTQTRSTQTRDTEDGQINKQAVKQELLKHPNLWRAGQLADQNARQPKGIPTGYSQLNEKLPGKGWPAGGLMEFMLTSAGIGELRLLVPALQALSHEENRWVAWINPPFVPYAPALQSVGIDTSKILLIHPRNHKDALWALERACKSGTCSTTLAWLDEKKLKLKDTQRLQLAAKQGRTLSCLFRPQTAHAQSSMAELRLALHTTQPGEISVDILKRRGGWPLHGLTLPIAETTATAHQQPEQIQQQLDLWRAFQQKEQGRDSPERHKNSLERDTNSLERENNPEQAMDALLHAEHTAANSRVQVH